MLDTAEQMASHLVNPSIRFFLTRTSLRVRKTLLANYNSIYAGDPAGAGSETVA